MVMTADAALISKCRWVYCNILGEGGNVVSASVLTPFFHTCPLSSIFSMLLLLQQQHCQERKSCQFDWNFRFENQVIRKAFPDATIFIINFELEVSVTCSNVSKGRSQMILYVEMK